MSNSDRKILSELDRQPIEAIDMMISRAKDNADQSNASHLRMGAILAWLKREQERRAKAAGIERDAPGRSR